MSGKCLTRVWHWWAQVRLHPLELLSVLRNHILSLYTLYLIRFWYLLSDAVNGSGGNWVSERWSNFPRATQLVRGKAGFHLKSVSSRAGSSPAGHSKGMRVFLWVCILLQSQVPHKYTRRTHSSGLLLSSCPLGSMLSLCSGCSTTWNIIPSRPPAFQPSSAHHTLQDLSPAKRGPLLNVFPKKRPYFPAGRCIQATFSLLSHTDRGFRKCQLSWLRFTLFKYFFLFPFLVRNNCFSSLYKLTAILISVYYEWLRQWVKLAFICSYRYNKR